MKITTAQLWVHDQEEALAFYTQTLGMEVRQDVTLAEMGNFRWLTVAPPGQSEVEIVLMAIPGPPVMDDATAEQVRELMGKGFAGTVFLTTDDVQGDYEQLRARGLEFLQPPTQMPYGVDCGFRDPSGNHLRLGQLQEVTCRLTLAMSNVGAGGLSLMPAPMREQTAAIRLRGVIKRFGAITAVDGLDLDVPYGTCVGLLGPNGAGKSTTMKALTAQVIADEGELEVLGFRLPGESKQARAEMGVVPQLDNLDVALTVRQNLLVFTYLYRVERARARRRRSTARLRSPTSPTAPTPRSTS